MVGFQLILRGASALGIKPILKSYDFPHSLRASQRVRTQLHST